MGFLFSKYEDRLIIEGLTRGDKPSAIAERLPRRTKSSVRHRGIDLHLIKPNTRGGARKFQKKKDATKSRTCLFGRHPFDAAVDEAGRFKERICKKCKATPEWRSGGAMG